MIVLLVAEARSEDLGVTFAGKGAKRYWLLSDRMSFEKVLPTMVECVCSN